MLKERIQARVYTKTPEKCTRIAMVLIVIGAINLCDTYSKHSYLRELTITR